MASVRVVYNAAVEKELKASVAAAALLQRVGDEIAADAAQAAPRQTGRLADSIHAEVVTEDGEKQVRVSWSSDAFYGRFVELGTSQLGPRPFLRPAAETRRHI